MAKYKIIECKDSVESAIDSGISELEELQSEMDSWASGMEGTNLENSDKCQTVRETADTLENSSSEARRSLDNLTEEIQRLFDGESPVFPESYQSPLEREVTWTESRPYGRHVSRANRLGSACSGIRAGIEGLRDWLASFEKDNESPPEWTVDISSHVDELEQSVEECESVDFPGMYG